MSKFTLGVMWVFLLNFQISQKRKFEFFLQSACNPLIDFMVSPEDRIRNLAWIVSRNYTLYLAFIKMFTELIWL